MARQAVVRETGPHRRIRYNHAMSHPLNAQLGEALALERSGRVPEAILAYERLLARFPDLPDCWYNLGRLRRRVGRFDAALAAYQQALDRGVTQPEEVHLNRSVIYADDLRQDAAADHELAAALALNPRYLPALLNLANLHEDLGRRGAALAVYEQLLAQHPDCHEGLARYASLKSASTRDDPLLARLGTVLARTDVGAADKASLGFALGKLLDDCGAYDEAFEAYAAANLSSRESVAVAGPLHDRARHERYIDSLIETFVDGPSREATAGPRTVTPQPIFICGMFRSGSTLAEQVLARHPRVTAGGELDLLPALVRGELAPFPATMQRITPEHLDSFAAAYLAALAQRFPGAQYVTDKRPDNFLYVGLIKRLFPEAKIVCTTRDPLDNCLSIFFLHLDQRMGYALDLLDIGHYYAEYRRLLAHWRTLYGADILEFDYDAFVREPRPAIGRLLEFCGLEWDERCLSPERAAGAVKTASVWQVRQPIYRSSSGRARHYARQLAPLAAWLAQDAKRMAR